jgi:hypothetical protein
MLAATSENRGKAPLSELLSQLESQVALFIDTPEDLPDVMTE